MARKRPNVSVTPPPVAPSNVVLREGNSDKVLAAVIAIVLVGFLQW